LLVVLGNITEIKKAEAALQSSEDRYKSLTENAPIVIFSINQNGELTYVNPAWSQILGYPRQEVIGQNFYQFLSPIQKSSHEKLFCQIINGQQQSAELKLDLVHSDGSMRVFDLTAAVHSDSEGRVMGLIGLAKDITEETRLQEQLLMSQKMKAVGTLAGGIAHDFNNLLMGIQANISLMRLEAASDSALMEKLTRVESQIQSGASLTRQLLGYARKGRYGNRTIDLRRLIEDTLHVVKRTNKQIMVHQQFGNEPLFMQADRGQIELVLLNLFVNAVDAMPDGGDLNLSASLVDAAQLDGQWPDLRPGCYIHIEVNDTGMGMDEQTRDRIFEPFFTTKEIGHGTGLGLASVYGVVKNHQGYIQAESSPGEGTTFKILLPASTARKAAETTSPADRKKEALFQPGGTILIVDDEPTILESCGELVQSLGYQVIFADSGDKAVRIYEKHHAKIDIVILDIIMPVLDGIGVYQALKAIDPDIKVIVSSGYGFNDKAKEILAQGAHLLLKKPYNRGDLAAALNELKITASKKPPRHLTLQ
jgi:PAS domain S-box-containing protein